MSCKRQQIDIHFYNINRIAARRLRSINTKNQVAFPRDTADIRNGHHCSRDIGSVGHKNRSGIFFDRSVYVRRINQAFPIAGNDSQFDTSALHYPQGSHHRIMFHTGCNNMIA